MRVALLLPAVTLCAAACGDGRRDDRDDDGPTGARGGAAPALATPNGSVGVTVGDALSYDASRGGGAFTAAGTLTYRVTFEGDANGLAASGPTVTGVARAPGVTWATLVATDALGRTASDRFAIAAFARGLLLPVLPALPFRYTDAANPLPAHFRAMVDGVAVASTDNTPADDPITDAGAALGRVLFYDARLSANDGLSCAGCHSPFISFSDTPPRSVGFAGGLTGRHSPALANARFYRRGRFFWDERAATLEEQVLRPIQDGTEMGMTLDDLAAKIAATSYYPPLFAAAFGTSTVTSERISRALSQFVRSLVSAGSRYDRAFRADGTPDFPSVLSAQEVEGERLFHATGCADCHHTVAQVSDSVHNVGLELATADTGAGHGAFKAPSLRNVGARPRFMHDGRFTTLEEVVDFFDAGVQPNPGLDPRLRNADGTPRRLGLGAAQKAALVAFLHTLTDTAFLRDPRFANPFAPGVPGTPPTVSTADVVIQATSYRPATITVTPGTVVTWTNLDNARHSATFASTLVGSTPIFNAGSQRLTMPTARGTYAYQCLVHGAQMRGNVIVQ